MMLILVWLCLLAKATAFTTESPNKTEEEKPCCVGSPKLLYSGHDSKHNINVFLFEFPPLKKESKAKTNNKNEEHTAKLGLDVTENVAPITDAKKKPEHEGTETNTPAYPQDGDLNSSTINDFTKGTSDDKQKTVSEPSGLSSNITKSNILKNDFDVETGSGPRAHTQNEHYKDYGAVKNSNLALNDEVKNTHKRKIPKANEQIDVAGYNSTNRISTDIPGYNQSSTVKFSSKEEDMLECNKMDGTCRKSSKHTNNTQRHPPTYRKVDSANPHDSDISSDTVSNFSNDHSIKEDNQNADKILSGTSKNATKPNNPTYHTDSGPKGVSQHKLNGEYGSIQNLDIALKDQAKHTYSSEVLKANEQSITDGYYSTDGITFTDIPFYNDSKVAEQDPNIRFPSTDIDMLKCTETNGMCKNDQVSNPPTHKKVHLDTKEHMNIVHTIKNQTKESDGKQQKIVTIEKNKSNKSPGQPNKNNKHISTKSSTGRDPRNGKAHRRWYNNEQFRHHRYHKHSSSESTSDSSQEFD